MSAEPASTTDVTDDDIVELVMCNQGRLAIQDVKDLLCGHDEALRKRVHTQILDLMTEKNRLWMTLDWKLVSLKKPLPYVAIQVRP